MMITFVVILCGKCEGPCGDNRSGGSGVRGGRVRAVFR